LAMSLADTSQFMVTPPTYLLPIQRYFAQSTTARGACIYQKENRDSPASMVHRWLLWMTPEPFDVSTPWRHVSSARAGRTVVVLMCGLSAPGKSRSAEWLLSACEEESRDATHIEYDQVEDGLLIAANDGNQDDDEYTKELGKRVGQSPCKLGSKATRATKNVIPRFFLLDDNFHLLVRSMRREVFRICREFAGSSSPDNLVHFVVLWLDLPKDVCLKRNIQRARSVPPDIIDRMSTALQQPG
jgi:predicted kinase